MKRIQERRSSALIRKAAIEQVRAVRGVLRQDHPELFHELEMLVGRFHKDETFCEQEMVSIDRAKNLEAVLKFVALKPASESLQREIKNYFG